MFIAKIENSQITQVIDSREVFATAAPTVQQLVENSYMQVNLFRPHDRLTEKLVQCEPVIEGSWVYTVEVQSMTAEEIQAAKDSAMAQIRGQRNRLLLQSDYTQIADNPDPKKAEWAAYRQALRDLPANITSDPRTFVDWPTDPVWQPIGQ
jgi:hypothetical protein